MIRQEYVLNENRAGTTKPCALRSARSAWSAGNRRSIQTLVLGRVR